MRFASLKGVGGKRRLVSFSERRETFGGIRRWPPLRGATRDLGWVGIPVVTYNYGSGYIITKRYASKKPTSWILQEMNVHNRTRNIAIASRRGKGIRRYGL